MAGSPKDMIENPDDRETGDVLSNVLRTIRVSGSLQFCFMPTGAWQTDPKSSMKGLAASAPVTMPFHILVEGSCWLRMEDQQVDLVAGDVVAFPFGTPHDLGAGENGRFVAPDRRPSAKAVAGNPDAALRRRLAARAAALRLPAMRRDELPSSARCLAQAPARANRKREGCRMALRDNPADRRPRWRSRGPAESRCWNG